MTVVLAVTHEFVSAIADDADTSLVRPSNWNEPHVVNGVDGINAELAGKVNTTRTLTAGAGLTGGGDLSADRTFAVNTGTSGNTVPLLNGANTWTKPQTPTAAALTSGAAADFTANQLWSVTVSGSDFTVANPSVAPTNRTAVGIIISFSTANAVIWGSKYKKTGYTAGTSGRDYLEFIYDSGLDQYHLIGVRNAVGA